MRNAPTCKILFGFAAATDEVAVWGENCLNSYVDDIICTVSDEPDEYWEVANSSQNNLQFTLEEVNMEGDLDFLYISVNGSSENKVTCHW